MSEPEITVERLVAIGFQQGELFCSILLPPVNPNAAITELTIDGDNVVCLRQGVPGEPNVADDHVVLTSLGPVTWSKLLALLQLLGYQWEGIWLRDWPNDDFRFWWMEYRIGKRGKAKVMPVEFVIHDGTEYVRPFQDNNSYPRKMVKEWKARFKPCVSEPVFE